MAYTANKNLEQVARGADVGTWDTPTNSNWGIVDQSFGGLATVALTNSPVILSPTQYQCAFINFTGAISANIAITLPAVGSFYTIQNLTTNSSAFYVTMGTTAAGGQQIGLPPGEATEIFTDGTNVKYRALGRVGTYWDYAGSSVPAWVSACTVPPYLSCDGTSFSSATYPALASILGGTTLPDSRGRVRASLSQGTARLTTVISSDVVGAAGGDQNLQSHSHAAYIYDPGHTHTVQSAAANGAYIGGGSNGPVSGAYNTGSNTTGVRVNNQAGGAGTNDVTATAGTGSGGNVQPTYLGGITLIRAA